MSQKISKNQNTSKSIKKTPISVSWFSLLFLITGCGPQWTSYTKAPAALDRDLLMCQAQATSQFPPAIHHSIVQDEDAIRHNQELRRKHEFFIGNDCRTCTPTPRSSLFTEESPACKKCHSSIYRAKPEDFRPEQKMVSVDRNQKFREKAVQYCMSDAGWHQEW